MPQAIDAIKNPVKRDGVSQAQRRLTALDPSYVKVEERDLQDFLVFALEFSRQLIYYNFDDKQEGDWEAFWGCNPALMIAAIERTNPQSIRDNFLQIKNSQPLSSETLFLLIDEIRKTARKIDDWFKSIPSLEKFNRLIENYIVANLSASLPRLIGYEKGIAEIFDRGTGFEIGDYSDFSTVWNIGEPDLIEPDTSLFSTIEVIECQPTDEEPAPPTSTEQLETGCRRLESLFTEMYNILFQIIGAAPAYFEDNLNRDDHEPHFSLFVTFLRLYIRVKDDLNRMTQRHLDFFYRKVLKLQEKDSIPDKVHLFFELAKQVQEHPLKKDIRFKAGKDDTGQERFYTLDQDDVFNKAKIESLRTIFGLNEQISETQKEIISLHAAPVANSKDGKGEAFEKTEEKPSWPTLGSASLDEARLGIAIASRELLLQEGTRSVLLRLTMDGLPPITQLEFDSPPNTSLPTALQADPGFAILLPVSWFTLFLSGEKEWLSVEGEPIEALAIGLASNSLNFYFRLRTDFPPVLQADPEALKEDLGTNLPVLKIYFNQFVEQTETFIYEYFRQAKVEEMELTVDVAEAVNVLAFNDLGPIDVTKPFMPFGPTPKFGSSFYVGSLEAFQKNLEEVSLSLLWESVPVDFEKRYQGYSLFPPGIEEFTYETTLLKSEGNQILDDYRELFSTYPTGEESDLSGQDAPGEAIGRETGSETSQLQVESRFKDGFLTEGDKIGVAIKVNELENYGLQPTYGFLRLNLLRDFGHSDFPNILTRQMIAFAKLPGEIIGAIYLTTGTGGVLLPVEGNANSTTGAPGGVPIPKEPYTPTVKSLKLKYKSRAIANYPGESEDLLFLHLHPFANTYQQFGNEALNATLSLLATFEEEGNLYIGIKDLKPLENLSILFQVAENTADAGIPLAKINWYYLASNKWIQFNDFQIVSDTTEGLITSGIVSFAIPANINKDNTILPADLHWIKASTNLNSAAISEMIAVHAQATRVTFQNNNNDPNHLQNPLPAGQISKLELADAAIKTIAQEYESFGGQPPEKPIAFYTRISEHLRHKGRAITLFDYERLVLEQFPDIYKVKCINHTNQEHELRPGHVLIAVIPDFTQLKAVDRRQPQVTLSKLEKIKEFLEKRNTAFVSKAALTLHILNPLYEEIKVSFSVKFKPEITAKDFYRRELQKNIVRFLSPWAFENGAEINFGGKVYKSSILNFVEEQDFVDYVIDFKMMHDGGIEDLKVIDAKTPRSILVPVNEAEINICIIGEDPDCLDEDCPMENAVHKDTLGYVTTNQDFIIDKNNS